MSDNSIGSRLKSAWNAFFNKDPTTTYFQDIGSSYSYRPDRSRFTRGTERSIVAAVYNRISMDCAALDIKHVQLDYNDRFIDVIYSGLNNCLQVEANRDQTGRAFVQDMVMSLLDEGCIAVVPVVTSENPFKKGSYEIEELRVGRIVQWYPKYVRVNLYNEDTGKREELVFPKSAVAIIENPLYSVMNEHNSTLQRLIRKLNLLDMIDENNSSSKLDLIIQLPFSIKSEARKKQAEVRRADIEKQLATSKYGVAYTDATEKVTQLNRPVENTLMKQVEYLTSMLYSQLGLSTGVMDGTADDKVMQNYHNRTIEPIMSAITDEMKRKFLTKNARTRGQSIEFYKSMFTLVPVENIADIADKMTRNEIMSPNEIRQVVGLKPSEDPSADELRNRNINQSADEMMPADQYPEEEIPEEQY